MANDNVTVTIRGLDELQATLEDLGTKEAKAIVRAGLKDGAKEVQQGIAAVGTSAPGEIGEKMGQPSTWKISTSLRSNDLAGTARIKPHGSLDDLHHSKGIGRQPKGSWYHRSIVYLLKLQEFGPSGGKYHGSRLPVMSAGFESSKQKALDKIIATIKERLHL